MTEIGSERKGVPMILSSSLSFSSSVPTVVALGCFDGVHLGHMAVIRRAKAEAERLGVALAVWSFARPPKNYFLPHSVPLITEEEEKTRLIGQAGADIFIRVPFDKSVADMSAEQFFEQILVGQMRARSIVCGFNYRFGSGGLGTTALLAAWCDAKGMELHVVDPVIMNGVTVASSVIREAIRNGRPEEAASYLGRPYSLSASVIDGQKLARRLGFPTVNQCFPEGQVIPAHGVYVSRITAEGLSTPHFGITNVGLRPTVGGDQIYAETHIFDFDGDLYGQTLRVEFLHFLRSEVKFSSVESLAHEVEQNIAVAKEYLKNNTFENFAKS